MNDKDEIRTTTTLWFTSIATHSSLQKALIQAFLFFGHSHPLPGLSCPLLQWAPSPTRRATPPPSTPPTPPWRTASRTSGCLPRWGIYPTVPFWNFRFWTLLDCCDNFKPFWKIMDSLDQIPELKGSFQKKFYHPDIIFWIVIGCGNLLYMYPQTFPKFQTLSDTDNNGLLMISMMALSSWMTQVYTLATSITARF